MMESYLLAILVSMVLITIINIILNKKRAVGRKGKHYLFDIFNFISCYFIKRYSWVSNFK